MRASEDAAAAARPKENHGREKDDRSTRSKTIANFEVVKVEKTEIADIQLLKVRTGDGKSARKIQAPSVEEKQHHLWAYYTSEQLKDAFAVCENVVRRSLVGTAEGQQILRGVGVVPGGWVPGDVLPRTSTRKRKNTEERGKEKIGGRRTDPIQARYDEIIRRR